jgi:branched-chain amino acid transport system substrate-binding protein
MDHDILTCEVHSCMMDDDSETTRADAGRSPGAVLRDESWVEELKLRSRSASVLKLVLVAALMVTAACGTQSAGSSAPKDPYNVGLTVDMTGPNAGNGVAVKNGVQAYFEGLNKRGGVNGHQIVVQYLDDQGDPSKAAANFVQMKLNKVLAVTGSLSPTTGALSPLAISNKIPLVADNASKGDLNPAKPYTYVVAVQYSELAGPSIAVAKSILPAGPQRVGIANTANSNPAGYASAIAAASAALGWTVVDQEAIDITNASPTVQMNRLLAAKPTVIFAAMADANWTTMLQAQKTAGSPDIPLIAGAGTPSVPLLFSLKNPSILMMSPYTIVDKANIPTALAQYASDVQAIGGDPSQAYTLHGYLQGRAVAGAIGYCGDTCTGEKVEAALENLKISPGGLAAGTTIGYTPQRHELLGTVAEWLWDSSSSTMKVGKTNLPASAQ